MNSRVSRISALAATLGAAWLTAAAPAHAFDAEAAQALAKKNDCLKCHAVDKEKKGPSYKKIAAKLKGKPDGEAEAIKNITTGPKVKLDDGTEEEHKIIKTKDEAAIKNLVQWILAQ
jgi:cytochrome c